MYTTHNHVTMKFGNESIVDGFTEVHKIYVTFFMSTRVFQWPEMMRVFCAVLALQSMYSIQMQFFSMSNPTRDIEL